MENKNVHKARGLENMLLAKQIKPTAVRLLVLDYILQQTAAVALVDLERVFKYSDKTTLYRTLKTFEEKGMIHIINDGADATKYALCDMECKPGVHVDLHIHFYCNICKDLLCLPEGQMPDVILPKNFRLQEISLVAKGICPRCAEHCN